MGPAILQFFHFAPDGMYNKHAADLRLPGSPRFPVYPASSEWYPTGNLRLLPDTDTALLHPPSEPRAGNPYLSSCTQHPDHFHHMESFAAFPLSSLKYIIFAFFRDSLYFNFCICKLEKSLSFFSIFCEIRRRKEAFHVLCHEMPLFLFSVSGKPLCVCCLYHCLKGSDCCSRIDRLCCKCNAICNTVCLFPNIQSGSCISKAQSPSLVPVPFQKEYLW